MELNVPITEYARTSSEILFIFVTKAFKFINSSNEKNSSEIGGPKGLDPTRYGDWERKGRAIDF